MTKHPGFLLRLPSSIREDAVALAKADGISLNHFISIALAEKLTKKAYEDAKRPSSQGPHLNRHVFRRVA